CSESYGNPSSVHGFGRDARSAVDAARERVAGFLRVRADELVFTSGGTESDNFGVKGLALARGRGHVITSRVEHHAVLRSAQALEAQGFTVTYLPVDQYGMVDPDDVRRALRPDTIAISIMHANSEVGTIQPVRAIGALARDAGVPFHVESESIVLGLDLKGIAVSAGSACTAGSVEPSHVLVAMGVPLDWAMGAVRSSLGRSTTTEDVDFVVASVTEVVSRIRQAMPVG